MNQGQVIGILNLLRFTKKEFDPNDESYGSRRVALAGWAKLLGRSYRKNIVQPFKEGLNNPSKPEVKKPEPKPDYRTKAFAVLLVLIATGLLIFYR